MRQGESSSGTPQVILVVEDEDSIRRFLRPSLKGEGFAVSETDSGREALKLVDSLQPDLVLLDLGLPDIDGIEVLRGLRKASAVPVIIITARGREEEKIAGLDAGAEDYLTKPFSVGELLARIRVALRHRRGNGDEAAPAPYVSGDLSVDTGARIVRVGGREVHLTPQEFNILSMLVRRAGRVVMQRHILKEVWGHAGHEESRNLRLYIHQLREKIEKDPARPRHIVTEPGVGYRLKEE
jgi:two-component system KDP operon response regulator KdpE